MAGLTYSPKTVTLTGLGEGYTVELLELNLGHGDRWGYATLQLPKEYAIDFTTVLGNLFTIKLAGSTIFQGWMAEIPTGIEPQSEMVRITLFDVRWLLARRKIGAHGIGNGGYESAGVGGFPIVAYRVHFNPDGFPNRSQNPVAGSTDVFTFAVDADAAAWRLRDALYLLLKWYAPELTAPAHDGPMLGTNWDKEIQNWQPYGRPVGAAITDLCAEAGESWAITFDDGEGAAVNVNWVNICHTPDTTTTFRLPELGGTPAQTSASTELQIVRMNATPRITDSADIVEVHSNRILVETTVASLLAPDTDVSKVLNFSSQSHPGWVVGLEIEPTKYETAQLGKNLAAGSRNKPWRTRLLTLAQKTSAAYYDAFPSEQFLSAQKLSARTLSIEDCVWLKNGDDGDWYKLEGGYMILPEEGRLLIGDMTQGGVAWGKGMAFDVLNIPTSKLFVKITIVVEIEDEYIYSTTNPTTWHLNQTTSPGKKLVEMVVRSDLHPMLRYRSHLPNLDKTGDPDEYTIAEEEATEAVAYFDVTSELESIAKLHLAALKTRENEVQIELLDLPVLNLGDKIAIAPGSANLVGNEVIVGLRYNFQQGDRVTVLGTNNLARLMVHDL